MIKYWSDKALGGGPLVEDFKVKYSDDQEYNVKLPLLETIKNSSTYGFFNVNRIAFAAQATYYLDAWVLSTDKEDAKALNLWSSDPNYKNEVKCCWNSGLQVSKSINGFARILHYFDQYNEGAQPSSTFQIWEG